MSATMIERRTVRRNELGPRHRERVCNTLALA